MTIAQAEELKSELTDKYVVVESNVAELRRFDGLTGTVKTVNMNGRALVQFDSAEDISWYDIDPAYLKVIDQPLPKQKAEAAAEKKPAKAAAVKKATGGGSPLDAIRSQGAATKEAGSAEKKASPLDAIRAQGAAGGAAKPKEAGAKPSPLDMIRQQGAAGEVSDVPQAPPEPAPPKGEPVEPQATEPAEPAASSDGPVPVDKSGMSTAEVIALAREQGAFKG